MSCYDDALLMDECWEAYLSSFSSLKPPRVLDERFKNMENRKEDPKLDQFNNRIGKKKNSTKKERGQSSLNNFCDSLAFTVQSKLYVLELNLERKLVNFKSFLRNNLPSWLTTADENKRNECNRSSSTTTIEDTGMGTSGWASRLDPASSRRSLGVQQEKILTRLEQVLQAKRNTGGHQTHVRLFNMELHDRRYRSMGMAKSSSSYSFLSRNQVGFILKESSSSAKQKTPYKRRSRWIPRSATWLTTGTAAHSEQRKLCAVCYTNPPNIVTLPCAHHEICSDCFMEIIYMSVKQSQYPLKCVICRQKIEKIRCSRKLLLNFIQKNRLRP